MQTQFGVDIAQFIKKTDFNAGILYLEKPKEKSDQEFLAILQLLLKSDLPDIQEIVISDTDGTPSLDHETLNALVIFAKKEKIRVFLKDKNPAIEDLDLWMDLENTIVNNGQNKTLDEKSEIISAPLLRPIKKKRRQIPVKTQLQYHHQHHFQQQIQVQKQIQSQQQIQAQQQVVTHEQRLFIDSKQVSSLNLIDLKGFILSESFRKKCVDLGLDNMMHFWDLIVGDNAEYLPSSIRYITVAALEKILLYHHAFLDGVDPEHLPEGFFLKEIKDEGFILCFDPAYPSNVTPLTTRLLPAPKPFLLHGNGHQFGINSEVDSKLLAMPLVNFSRLEDTEAKRNFILYLRTSNEQLAEEIEQSSVFQQWTRKSSLEALLPILVMHGAKGVSAFIQLLEKIPEKYRESFQAAFLDNHDNWSSFLESPQAGIFDLFKNFSPAQWTWWNDLTTRQAAMTGLPLNLADLFHGFRYFVHHYQDLVGEDLPISSPFQYMKLHNMKVQMGRLLTILRIAVNPKEQAKNLFDFTATGPYYAMRNEHFFHTIPEMELASPLTTEYRYWNIHPSATLNYEVDSWGSAEKGSVSRDPGGYAEILLAGKHYSYYFSSNRLVKTGDAKSFPIQEPHYAVDDEELLSCITDFKNNDKATLDHTKIKFYRYLGKQKFIFSFDRYRLLLAKISKLERKNYSKSSLIVLLAFGSVGIKGSDSDLEKSMEVIINLTHDNADIFEYLLRWKRAKIAFNLNELALITTLIYVVEKTSRSEAASQLLDQAKKYPNYFLPALVVYSKHSPTTSVKYFFDQIEKIEKILFAKIDEVITEKILMLIALVNQKEYFETFFDLLLKFSPEKIARLLDVVIQSDFTVVMQKKLSWQKLTNVLSTLHKDSKEEKSSEWDSWLFLFPPKTKELLQDEEVDPSFVAKMLPKTDLWVKVRVGSLSPALQWVYQYRAQHTSSSSFVDIIYNLINSIQKESSTADDENFIYLLKEDAFFKNYSPELLLSILEALQEMMKRSPKHIFPISILQHLKNLGDTTLSTEKQLKLLALIPAILKDDQFNKAQKKSLLTIAFHELGDDVERMHKLMNRLHEVKEDAALTPLTKLLEYYPATLENNIDLMDWAAKTNPQLLPKCLQLFDKFAALHYPYSNVLNAILDEKNSNKRQYLIIISENFAPTNNLDVILKSLASKDEGFLKLFAKLVELRYINYKEVEGHSDNLESVLHNAQIIPPFPEEQDLRVIKSLIQQIQNLSCGHPESLSLIKQKKLFKWFTFVKLILFKESVLIREDGSKPSVANLTYDETATLIKRCKFVLNDPFKSNNEKTKAKLLLLALLCKVMYHTTHLFPNDAQILTVLNTWLEGHEHSIFSRILAGEGKTMVIGLVHALDCLLGKSVDVVTQNPTLAHDGFTQNYPFFKALDIPIAHITSQSSTLDYCKSGINYSDIGEFSLFQERNQLEHPNEPFNLESNVLALDEGDYILRDNHHMIYRHSGAINDEADSKLQNLYEWLYPLVNDFIDDEGFTKDEIADHQYATLFKKRYSEYQQIGDLDSAFLISLLNDAISAKFLQENHDYCIRKSTRRVEEENIPVSVAFVMEEKIGRISERSEFMGRVQQLLHTRLNKLGKGIPYPFPIDPAANPKASLDSRSLIKRYPKVAAYSGTWEAKPAGIQSLLSGNPAQLFVIPPFHKDGLTVEMPEIVEEKNFNKRYFANAKEALDEKQHVIIVLKTIEEAEAMFDYFKSQPAFNTKKIQLCHANKIFVGDEEGVITDEKTEQEAIKRAGTNGFVTITTTMLGRGANILSDQESCFVCTNEADDPRNCEQIFRRASRYGQKGRAKLIVQQDKLKLPLNATASSDPQKRIEQHQEVIALSNERNRQFFETGVAIRQFFFHQYLKLKNAIPLENTTIKNKLDVIWENYLAKREKEWDEIFFHLSESIEFEEQFHDQTNIYIERCIQKWSKLVANLLSENNLKIGIRVEKLIVQADDKLEDKENNPIISSLTHPKKENIIVFLEKPKALRPILSPIADKTRTLDDSLNEEAVYCDLMLDTDGSLNINRRREIIVFRQINALTEEKLNHDNFENIFPEILEKLFYNNQRIFIKIAEIIGNQHQSSLTSRALKAYKSCFSNLIKANALVPIHEIRSTVFELLKLKSDQKQDLEQIKDKINSELNEYKRKWRVARDRKDNADKLIADLKTTNTYDQVLKLLSNARKNALNTDEQVDRAAWFFNRNPQGSRYQRIINKLQEYTLTEADQQFDYQTDIADLSQLISSLINRLPHKEKFNPLRQLLSDTISGVDDQKIQTLVENLSRIKLDINRCSRDIRHLFYLTLEKAEKISNSMRQSRQGKKVLDERCIRDSVQLGIDRAKHADDYKLYPKERMYAEVADHLRHSKRKIKIQHISVSDDAIEIEKKQDENEEKKDQPLFRFSF